MSLEDVNKETLFGYYRILELADEKGVYSGNLLGGLGADVVKIEPPGGDKTRSWPPFLRDEVHPEKSLYFLNFNTNKRGITLNLEHEDGREIFKQLVKTADAVVETFPAGYMESLGLDYPVLKEINPGLVMCSITPFGQTGPYRNYKACDLVNMAMGGFMQICGEADEPPVRLGGEQSFIAGSYWAAAAIAMALFYRETSGKGQYIDISIQEASIPFLQDKLVHQHWALAKINLGRYGNWSPAIMPWGGFPCKDGWVFIGVVTPKEWDDFSQWVYDWGGDKEMLNAMYKGGTYARASYVDILGRLITEFTKRYTKEELFTGGQKRGIVVLPVYTAEDIANCSQLESQQFFIEADHPVAGRLKYPRGPFYCDDAPWKLRRPAPLLGEHNEEIYCQELDISKEELALLRGGGII